jgi:hypothetical protein
MGKMGNRMGSGEPAGIMSTALARPASLGGLRRN